MALDPSALERWSPRQHPHIEIVYEPRTVDPETGLPEPQSFEVTCATCGQRWRGSCTSGRMREKALVFAARHVHEHPFDRKT